jgi:hypothetical protein
MELGRGGMGVVLRWAPLEYGSLWAVVLVYLGLRLRRLGAAMQVEERA